MKIKYNLLKTENNTKARRGKLHTNYVAYETPMYMPVGTLENIKTITPKELKACSSAVVLSNRYQLS